MELRLSSQTMAKGALIPNHQFPDNPNFLITRAQRVREADALAGVRSQCAVSSTNGHCCGIERVDLMSQIRS